MTLEDIPGKLIYATQILAALATFIGFCLLVGLMAVIIMNFITRGSVLCL